jgi:hypothetical protein
MNSPVNQEIINDAAKLIMHRLIARSLATDPSLINRAKSSLAEMATRFPDRSFVAEWATLLDLPAWRIRLLLTRRNSNMNRLRLSSPFVIAEGVDFSDDTLRRRIRRAARRVAAPASRSGAGHRHSVQPVAG